jgi:hypothetical protein
MRLLLFLLAIRGGVYTLLSLTMAVWWVMDGMGGTFANTRLPFWTLLPASLGLAGSIWLHRQAMRGRGTGFWPAIVATEFLLWSAVFGLGFRPAFLLWGLAQIGAIVLSILLVMPIELRLRSGFMDPEVREYGRELAGHWASMTAVLGSVFAVIVGAASDVSP